MNIKPVITIIPIIPNNTMYIIICNIDASGLFVVVVDNIIDNIYLFSFVSELIIR